MAWLLWRKGTGRLWGIIRYFRFAVNLDTFQAHGGDYCNIVPPRVYSLFGKMTASITWITPLVQSISVAVTFASSTFTFPFSTTIATSAP